MAPMPFRKEDFKTPVKPADIPTRDAVEMAESIFEYIEDWSRGGKIECLRELVDQLQTRLEILEDMQKEHPDGR